MDNIIEYFCKTLDKYEEDYHLVKNFSEKIILCIKKILSSKKDQTERNHIKERVLYILKEINESSKNTTRLILHIRNLLYLLVYFDLNNDCLIKTFSSEIRSSVKGYHNKDLLHRKFLNNMVLDHYLCIIFNHVLSINPFFSCCQRLILLLLQILKII